MFQRFLAARMVALALALASFLILAGVPAYAQGVLDKKFTRSSNPGAATVFDLHVRFNTAISKVQVVDANGNVIANPGPFSTPPSGVGTNEITFEGGSLGSVLPGGTAPTQPGTGLHRYRFHGQAKPLKIKEWWWTDSDGMRSHMFEDDCLAAGRLLEADGICVASASDGCVLGTQPAATLLLPYFELDLDHPFGLTTLVAVGNASTETELARLILWTDAAVPTLTVYVLLSPSDVQTINIRDVFAGHLPNTASLFVDGGYESCTIAHLAANLSSSQL